MRLLMKTMWSDRAAGGWGEVLGPESDKVAAASVPESQRK